MKLDDQLVIHMGTVIPFDGTVVAGEAMVNQASLTGESVAVRESRGQFRLCRNRCGRGRADDPSEICGRQLAVMTRSCTMIEESEKLKSGVESKAEHLADRLVPYSLVRHWL